MNYGILDRRWNHGFNYDIKLLNSKDTESGIGIHWFYYHLKDCLSRSFRIYLWTGKNKYGIYINRIPNPPDKIGDGT